LAQGEILQPGDASWGLQKLQRLIDSWNVQRDKIFAQTFNVFSNPPNTQPVTIGPGGTFQMNQRPTKLVSASLLLPNSNGSTTDLPIYVQDADWWAAQTIKNLSSTFPTSVYYEVDNPLGNLYFWPIATGSYQVRLETWIALTQAIDMTTLLGFPQGYWEAIVSTLAVQMAPSYGAQISPGLARIQSDAVRAITNNNSEAPRICTAGQGMPGRNANGAGMPDYNFLVGPFGPRN
jgi:hypothetical protein